MQARYLAKYTTGILIGFILLLLGAGVSQAAVLFSSTAESGTCDTGVSTSIWDYTGSGGPGGPLAARMFYRCDTPVPNSGRSKYFRVDTVNLMQGTWNVRHVNRINLTPGVTYYLGAFFRFDRILGLDIWHDAKIGNDGPDSFDKLFESDGSVRWIINSGWMNGGFTPPATNTWDHKFTFNISLPGASGTCTNCGTDTLVHNFSPYTRSNPFLCDYEKWYAVVMAITPSTGGSSTNGRLELFINGTKVSSHTVKTQDTSTPYIESFQYSGTIAQPSYDSPPHFRKIDYFIFSDSLADVQNAGLMSDPAAGAPAPPTNLRVQ